MNFFKLIRALGSPHAEANGHSVDDPCVLDHGSFGRELQRRRALVDRAGGRFVLVVFDAPINSSRNGNGNAGRMRLCEVIKERARMSDIIGSYDASGNRIAVILPETTATGATTFVKSVDDMVRDRLNGSLRKDVPLACEISHYPDNGITADGQELAVQLRRELACGDHRS
jgi:hypothetical protein